MIARLLELEHDLAATGAEAVAGADAVAICCDFWHWRKPPKSHRPVCGDIDCQAFVQEDGRVCNDEWLMGEASD